VATEVPPATVRDGAHVPDEGDRRVALSPTGDRARAILDRRQPAWFGGLGFVVIATTLGVGWAAASVLTPAADPLEATDFTYVSVATGEVGSSISLNTVAEWSPVPVGSNLASGVVTGVAVTPGDEVSQGAVLYRVNERPVVVAQGDVPAFRAIGAGQSGKMPSRHGKLATWY